MDLMDQGALRCFNGHDLQPDATDQWQLSSILPSSKYRHAKVFQETLAALQPLLLEYSLPERAKKPAWLEALLTDRFFVACPMHVDLKKNENNIFCIHCSRSICHHCLLRHRSHRLLQVRRYVYHDVIRLDDLKKLVDCSHVQSYIINNARVVFLKQRPQSRPAKGFSNYCSTCQRSLQESYRYCCIACKVESVLGRGQNLSSLPQPSCKAWPFLTVAYSFGGPRVGEGQAEEGFSCGDYVLDDRLSRPPSSSSSTSNDTEFSVSKSKSITQSPDRMRGTDRPAGPTLSPVIRRTKRKRRKGVPHRSPIC